MEAGLTICPFAVVTGVACPGCGMTRALVALLGGDAELAFSYHPLVFVFAAGLLAWVLMRRRRSERWRVPTLTTALVLLVVTWVIRLATGTLPPV